MYASSAADRHEMIFFQNDKIHATFSLIIILVWLRGRHSQEEYIIDQDWLRLIATDLIFLYRPMCVCECVHQNIIKLNEILLSIKPLMHNYNNYALHYNGGE